MMNDLDIAQKYSVIMLFFCCLVRLIRKTCQCMKDVMDHAIDKVLENALANGSESPPPHTHTETLKTSSSFTPHLMHFLVLASYMVAADNCHTQSTITSVSHCPPSEHGTNQGVILSPLKAYLKRGILAVWTLSAVLCDFLFTAHKPVALWM